MSFQRDSFQQHEGTGSPSYANNYPQVQPMSNLLGSGSTPSIYYQNQPSQVRVLFVFYTKKRPLKRNLRDSCGPFKASGFFWKSNPRPHHLLIYCWCWISWTAKIPHSQSTNTTGDRICSKRASTSCYIYSSTITTYPNF